MFKRGADHGQCFRLKPEGIPQEGGDFTLVAAHGRVFALFVERNIRLWFESDFHGCRASFRDREEDEVLLGEDKHQSCQSPSKCLGTSRLWRPKPVTFVSPHSAIVVSNSLWITSSARVTPA